jgi:hypothetical protein
MKRLFFSLVIICLGSLLFFTCEDTPLPVESESQTGQPSLVVANVMEDALSAPGIGIAEGSDFVAAGVGMVDQSATLDITIPNGVTIKQVLLYWSGGAVGSSETPNSGDAEILVNSTLVVGSLIGGPTLFFNVETEYYYFSAYRADITLMGLVSPGSNSLTVDEMDFTRGVLDENNGVGIIVIYDDGVNSAEIELRDGLDLAFVRFAYPLNETEPQTFIFPASEQERTARLHIFAGSVAQKPNGDPRDNKIAVTVGGTTTEYDNLLGSFEEDNWDSEELLITIPAGVTELIVELISVEVNSGSPSEQTGASMSWIVAGLSVPVEEIEKAAIGDFVWIDTNMDGIQDEGEPGKEGVTVTLYDCEDTFIASTTTDNNGFYLFDNLMPGDYYVEFEKPAGYDFTMQDQGGDDAKDSDADPATRKTICTTLEEGETDLTWDAGLYEAFGCTHTQGYWKTHAGEDNKKRDATWDKIEPDAEDSDFFQSDQSYYEVMYTNPKGGNAYYILAHQYIAAQLNVLSGASIPVEVEAAWNEATELFKVYTPEEIGALEGEDELRQQFIDIAELLDDYNNGVIGPGHCE